MKENFDWAKVSVTSNYKAGEKPHAPYGVDGETVAQELGVKYHSFRDTVVDFVKQVKETLS
jgi:hypothetical protein